MEVSVEDVGFLLVANCKPDLSLDMHQISHREKESIRVVKKQKEL
jgi:hypothetical protein